MVSQLYQALDDAVEREDVNSRSLRRERGARERRVVRCASASQL